MKVKSRIIISLVFIMMAVVVFFFTYSADYDNTINIIILSVAIFSVVFSLLAEPFFSKPVETIATSVSIILLLLPQRNFLIQQSSIFTITIIDIFLIYCCISLVFAITSQVLLKKDESRSATKNQASYYIKVIIEKVANSKILYLLTGLILLLMLRYDLTGYLIIMVLYFILVFVISKNQKLLVQLLSKIN